MWLMGFRHHGVGNGELSMSAQDFDHDDDQHISLAMTGAGG
jgi:hypothetical protein